MGFSPDLAEDGEKALSLLTKNLYVAAFVDIRMPGMEGIEVLERAQARRSPTRFFIMTAVRRPDAAARSTRAGAAEFITKPFDIAHIENLLREVTKESASRERPFRTEDPEEWKSARIVGKSRAILEVFLGVGKVADSDATVLLLGDRGVGKELVARCIHDLGTRGGGAPGRETGGVLGGDPVPRRGRRHPARPPGKAPPRAAGKGVLEAGVEREPEVPGARHRGDQPGPAVDDRRRKIPGGSLRPAERLPDPRPPPLGEAGGHPPSRGFFSPEKFPGPLPPPPGGLEGGAGGGGVPQL